MKDEGGRMKEEGRTPRVDALEILLGVFTEEQLVIMAQRVAEARTRAMDRRCTIEFSVEFNDKGYPRYWNVEDSGKFPEPKTYKAE